MSSEGEEKPKIIIDEDWKTQVEAEREQLRQQEAEQDGPTDSQSEPTATASSQSGQDGGASPPASFALLVQMVASQAMMALQQVVGIKSGEISPAEGEEAASPKELIRWAKHQIDTLAVLEEKTKGNLDEEELKYLTQTLQELRMAFISLAK
jgi:hypothetical protein